MPEKKGKYLTKQVQFGGVAFTLYSLDGVTWSSKKEELEDIHERHERQRQVLVDDTREHMKRERGRGARDTEETDEGYSQPKRTQAAAEEGEDIDELNLHEVGEDADEDGNEEPGKGRRGRPPKALQKLKPKKGIPPVVEPPSKKVKPAPLLSSKQAAATKQKGPPKSVKPSGKKASKAGPPPKAAPKAKASKSQKKAPAKPPVKKGKTASTPKKKQPTSKKALAKQRR